jgi:hypothetical protein
VRSDPQRLDDIAAAAPAIESHLERGTLADGLIFDAVRVRLIEIGEAVKDIYADLLASENLPSSGRTWPACATTWRTATSTRTTRSSRRPWITTCHHSSLRSSA